MVAMRHMLVRNDVVEFARWKRIFDTHTEQHRAVGGYDAYFGTYRVDEASGEVTQTLLGSLSPADVGKVLTRRMVVIDDRLTIELETTASDGRAIVRTLVWERTA